MFVHLHVHSTYSPDGLATPDELARKAKALGFTALALTDHMTVNGWRPFAEACEREGLVPLLGAELSVTSHHGTGHAVVVALNPDEEQHLSSLVRRGRPIRLADLRGCGLVTSACLGGVVAKRLGRTPPDWFTASDSAREYASVLGDRYYLEIQPAFGTTLAWVLSLGRNLSIPVLLSNDVHYLEPEDASRHRQPGLYLMSEAELAACSILPGYQLALEATYAATQSAFPRSTSRRLAG